MKYGVFGLNQFQLLWSDYDTAKEEAIRLATKHGKEFSVMRKVSTFDENGNEI